MQADAFEVVPIAGSGLGARATVSLPEPHAVVLREAPIATLGNEQLHKLMDTDTTLQTLIMQAAGRVPETATNGWSDEEFWPTARPASTEVIERFAELVYASLSRPQQERWMSLVDSFTADIKSPGGVLRSNAFTDRASGDSHLFQTLSRFNHSCAPNVSRAFHGRVVVVTTLRAVAASEQLCISYLSDADLARPTAERRAMLRERFAFDCECARCGARRHGAGLVAEPTTSRCRAEDVSEVVAAAAALHTSVYGTTTTTALPMRSNITPAHHRVSCPCASPYAAGAAACRLPAASPPRAPCEDATAAEQDYMKDAVASALAAAQRALTLQLHACAEALRSADTDDAHLVPAIAGCAEALERTTRAQRARSSDER